VLSDIINPIKVVVLVTLLFAWYYLNKRVKLHLYILLIISLNFLTEFLLSVCSYLELPIRTPYLISILIHHSLWLLILRENVLNPHKMNYAIVFFWAFAILNFVYIEWVDEFNYYSFIVGASIYLLFFIIESYKQLNKENVVFFISNNYILLFTPLLFFYGLSLMFGFKTSSIRSYIIYSDLSLYGFIINAACVAYYSLMSIFIYREKKNKTTNG
jgi:hypothetical protein